MGRYIKQDETRSELQQRIAAELRAKAAAQSKQEGDKHDLIEDSTFVENTTTTSSLAWLWGILAIIIVAAFVYVIIRANTSQW